MMNHESKTMFVGHMTVTDLISELCYLVQQGHGNSQVWIGLQGDVPIVPLDHVFGACFTDGKKIIVLAPDADTAEAELKKPEAPEEYDDDLLPTPGEA